ncbi:MAG: iron-sulfur cluster assembly protein [Anaerolineae bacterium]
MSDLEQLRVAVLQRLAQVIDPETGVDVVRMRLIEDLQVDETGRVSYTFRPSSPLCPIAIPLAIEIRRVVAATPGVTRQAMHVEGYVGSAELNALLDEVADEAAAVDC